MRMVEEAVGGKVMGELTDIKAGIGIMYRFGTVREQIVGVLANRTNDVDFKDMAVEAAQ